MAENVVKFTKFAKYSIAKYSYSNKHDRNKNICLLYKIFVIVIYL